MIFYFVLFQIKEKKNGPDPELIITSSAILENMGMNKHLEHKETEETKFDDLLTETAYALRKVLMKLLNFTTLLSAN